MGKKKIKEGIRKELINIGKTYHQDDCSFINIDDVVDYIYKTYHKGKDKKGEILETKPLLQKKHYAVIEDLLNEKIAAMEVTECNKWEFANLTSILARIQDTKG